MNNPCVAIGALCNLTTIRFHAKAKLPAGKSNHNPTTVDSSSLRPVLFHCDLSRDLSAFVWICPHRRRSCPATCPHLFGSVPGSVPIGDVHSICPRSENRRQRQTARSTVHPAASSPTLPELCVKSFSLDDIRDGNEAMPLALFSLFPTVRSGRLSRLPSCRSIRRVGQD